FNNRLVGEGETFPEKGYEGVPNGGIDWPYCTHWPNFPGAGRQGGVRGRGGMERFVGHRFSVRSLREAVTKMVVTGNVPFRFVELEAFRELMVLLNPNVANVRVLPSRWTVARDVVVFAERARLEAMADLAPQPRERATGVAISSDIWTGGNRKAYSVVKGHFVTRDWKLREVTLDFREMTGRHGGEEIADLVLEVVRDWDLVDRCVAFVCDNASSNTRAFHLLSGGSSRPAIFRPGMHVRYVALIRLGFVCHEVVMVHRARAELGGPDSTEGPPCAQDPASCARRCHLCWLLPHPHGELPGGAGAGVPG
ncbi:unnamed protein product, partial [Closterium sp. NIES-53]